jgi:hypothetical protein
VSTFLPWMLAAGIITVRDIRGGHMPVPSEYVASGALFAGLSVLGSSQPELAGVLAWGVLIAIALAASESTGSLGALISPDTGTTPGTQVFSTTPKKKKKSKGGSGSERSK